MAKKKLTEEEFTILWENIQSMKESFSTIMYVFQKGYAQSNKYWSYLFNFFQMGGKFTQFKNFIDDEYYKIYHKDLPTEAKKTKELINEPYRDN